MPQRRKTAPIFDALNNSLLFAMALIGLAVYVYQGDQSRQDGRLEATSILIETMEKRQDTQNDILLRMQEAQIAIAKQIERNTDKINSVSMDRFTDRDGLLMRDAFTEKLSEERDQRQEQHAENRQFFQKLETDLEKVKAMISSMPTDCPE